MSETATTTEVKKDAPQASERTNRNSSRSGRDARGARPQNGRRPRRARPARPRSEFDNKILGIRRVTRVVAGGRRFSFSVTIVIGNGKGKVGVGLGKAADTALAIEKATQNAKRNLITVPLTEDLSIPHDVRAKYDAAEVLLIPTPGKGFKAGSAVRTVLEFAGIKHVSAKILSRSKNHLNNARATVTALKMLQPIAYKMKTEKKAGKKDATKKQNK